MRWRTYLLSLAALVAGFLLVWFGLSWMQEQARHTAFQDQVASYHQKRVSLELQKDREWLMELAESKTLEFLSQMEGKSYSEWEVYTKLHGELAEQALVKARAKHGSDVSNEQIEAEFLPGAKARHERWKLLHIVRGLKDVPVGREQAGYEEFDRLKQRLQDVR